MENMPNSEKAWKIYLSQLQWPKQIFVEILVLYTLDTYIWMIKKQYHATVPLSTYGLLSQIVKLFVIGMGSAEQYLFEPARYWSALKGNILEKTLSGNLSIQIHQQI